MPKKASTTVTKVKVEKHSGSAAKATVVKDGKRSSGEGQTASKALSSAAKKLKR